MNMLGFVYLVLILGWLLIVLFLKCKKSITHRSNSNDNYADDIGSDQRQSPIHVIQLQHADIENEYQLLNANRQHSNNIDTTVFTTEAIINPAYAHDEENNISAPPPSYDEVMRQPENYPKVNNKITDVNT